MKEITRITTVQITTIETGEDISGIGKTREMARKSVPDAIKNTFDVDDVVVLNVQDFVRDVAEEEGADNGKVENAE